MDKEELAELIDAYADAKVTRNKYLCQEMINKLEDALTDIYNRLDAAPSSVSMD